MTEQLASAGCKAVPQEGTDRFRYLSKYLSKAVPEEVKNDGM